MLVHGYLVCRLREQLATFQVAPGSLSSVEHPEMSKWAAVMWLLVPHPLFDSNQTIVGPFDFLQYLLCVWILFRYLRVAGFRSFDVLTNAH